MQKFEILKDPSTLEGFWLVDTFNKMYPEESSIKGYALASLSIE